MARRDLSSEERKALLQDLAGLRADDDDATTQDPKWFLPLGSHVRALRMETLIVRGGRGAGKTALFHFLSHLNSLGDTLRDWPVPKGVVWVAGFDRGSEHPSEEVIGRFAQDHDKDEEQLRLFWYGWLCLRLAKHLRRPLSTPSLAKLAESGTVADPTRIALVTRTNLTALSGWLDILEAELAKKEETVVVTYDRLDRIKGTGDIGSRMTTSLLALWLAFADRYRHLRPKVFVREDLFQTALSAFPDASKLEARSVSIEWRVEEIYRVLLKHMGNLSDQLREWTSTGAKRVEFELGELGWSPPQSLPETGSPSQKEFVVHLVGEKIGSGQKKGYTHRWIPNHLQDAHGNIVPRSILSLIRNAAEVAINQGAGARGTRLLTPGELQGALEKTSLRRVAELKEEFPVVVRLENLRGREVMMRRRDAVEALSRTSDSSDEFGNDGESVLRRLIEIGVMKERTDGRIDVADIYGKGFGIIRRGGIKRAR